VLKITNNYPVFCLDTYVIRDKNCIGFCCEKPENLYGKIQIANESGYDAVELWHKDVVGLKQVDLKNITSMIQQSNLFVASYKVIENWFDDTLSNESIEIIEKASEIGAKSIVVKLLCDDKNHIKKPISFYTERYSNLIEKCNKYAIYPSIEFMSLSNTMNSIDDVCDILDGVGKGKLVLDTWHLWRNDDVDFSKFKKSLFRINPEQISVIHYTDASSKVPRNEQLDGDRKMPRKGCLKLSNFVQMMNQIGFSGVYSLNVYDKSLWDRNPKEVAVEGLYLMKQEFFNENMVDSYKWDGKQKNRCEGLWVKQYYTHLDPRIRITDRDIKLEEAVKSFLKEKIVLDFKCGFSPLGKYVTYGFDAFGGCIDYLKIKFPHAEWHHSSDRDFVAQFSKKIDVLLHIGLGDSDSEERSHYVVREKCKPKLVILECAANQDGSVNESKIGNSARWDRMSSGLTNKQTFFVKTNMSERSYRLILVGDLPC
jgi:sugar phosphate isomerase/epimerase